MFFKKYGYCFNIELLFEKYVYLRGRIILFIYKSFYVRFMLIRFRFGLCKVAYFRVSGFF